MRLLPLFRWIWSFGSRPANLGYRYMPRVVVVGAINVDLVISAASLPAPGETVVGSSLEIFGGGKGANAAVAAARAGAEVYLIGSVGGDGFGEGALQSLKKDRVNVDMVTVVPEVATGTALIAVDAKGENQIILAPGANAAISPDTVGAGLSGFLRPTDIVQISTEIPYEAVSVAAHVAQKTGVKWILNPAPVIPGLWDLLPLGPILTPNEKELVGLAGMGTTKPKSDTEDTSQLLKILTRRSGAPVVATLGSEGCALSEPNSMSFDRFPVVEGINVVDTTGAGDTFNGCLAARLSEGKILSSAVKFAVVAAGLSVMKIGAREGMPLRSVIDESMPEE